MITPWTKNPLLSMWLSGANAVLGAARGRANTELHRQWATAMTQGTRQMLRFWSDALTINAPQGAPPKRRATTAKGRKRKRQ